MAKQKNTDTNKLTPAEIEEFKRLLLAKRRELLGDVNHMEGETLQKTRSELSNMPFHMADMGTDNYEQEFTLGLVGSDRKVIIEISDALRRIDEGTFGICEGSGQPIPKKRLEAIPWARYCVEFAEKLEKGLAQVQGEKSEESFEDIEEN